MIADAGRCRSQSSDTTNGVRTEDMVQLDRRLHLVTRHKESRLGMSRENLQFDRIQQLPRLFRASRCPALVLCKLDALIAHLRDGLQRPVKIPLPVGQDGVDQQSDWDMFLTLRR